MFAPRLLCPDTLCAREEPPASKHEVQQCQPTHMECLRTKRNPASATYNTRFGLGNWAAAGATINPILQPALDRGDKARFLALAFPKHSRFL